MAACYCDGYFCTHLDHLTKYANSANQEQYLYDAKGERVLRRFTNGSGTTILTYPFGIMEHQSSGSGSTQWNVYYYFLARKLQGVFFVLGERLCEAARGDDQI